ncbi:MAG: hypothetical protein HIU57_06295 [Acidobacteria bacterium]|nr:hypothetical protein [Acidobacteriota bacterium]
MPNFVAMGRASVFSEMYSAQLYYKTQGPGSNSATWTRVVGEIPAAGTMIHPFSTVILDVTTSPVPVALHAPLKSTVKLDAVTRHVAKQPPRAAPRRVALQASVNQRAGVATWYSYVPGRCATWFLPMGTRINVEDLNNGHVISCVVTDREAARGNRVVDLSESQFAQLAPLGVGVVPVRVTW